MTLEADEFIRLFLLHALPHGFHRIRHYGFLANGGRSDNLARCRQLLDTCNGASPGGTEPTAEDDRVTGTAAMRRMVPPQSAHMAKLLAGAPLILNRSTVTPHDPTDVHRDRDQTQCCWRCCPERSHASHHADRAC